MVKFFFISVCHLTIFLDSGSLLVLSHLRLAHHTVLFYVVFVWRCALCLVRYCVAQDTGQEKFKHIHFISSKVEEGPTASTAEIITILILVCKSL